MSPEIESSSRSLSAGGSVADVHQDPDPLRARVTDSLLLAGAIFAFISIIFFLLRAAGVGYPIAAARLALPWLPIGAAAGTFLYRGVNRWPGAFAGVLIAGYFFFIIPLLQLVVQAAAITACAALVAYLLRVWRFDPSISHWRDPLLLWAAAAVGAACLAALAIAGFFVAGWYKPASFSPDLAAIVLADGVHPGLSKSLIWIALRWFGNWTTGSALVVPCVLVLLGGVRDATAARPAERLALALLLCLWVLAVFAPLPSITLVPLAAAAVLMVVWAAIRVGTAAASLVTLCLTLALSVSAMIGHGLLSLQPAEAVSAVWGFVTTVSAIGLLVTVLVSNRDAALRRYATLFDSNPLPIWVQERQSGRILMVNQAAVGHYGFSRQEFTQLSIANLQADDGPRGDGGVAAIAAFDGGEHRHRTRDGRLIDVILHTQPIALQGLDASLVFSYDVTERNHLRKALLDSTADAARKLGRELHEELGQELAGLSMMISSESARARRGLAPDSKSLDVVEAIARHAVVTCRNITHDLSALAESGGDLAIALERLSAQLRGEGAPEIHVEFQNESELMLPETARDHLYWIGQEALLNALKHARATRIDIRLAVSSTSVVFTIRDDGVGIPPTPLRRAGIGISSMQTRVAAIGARLYITPGPEGGTEVRVECALGQPELETTRPSARSGGSPAENLLGRRGRSRLTG
jgi:PAS domain S-box-containing protein